MTNPVVNQRTRHRSWLALAGLVSLVATVYWPVAGYEFVNWDDPWYVLKNPLIKSWHPVNLWRIATEMSVKNYAPLTTLSLLVDHTLFGLDAGGYHLHNVLLHAVNAVLVCLLVSRLTGHRAIGLITAALFAVHPVQIETVAWVSSRKTLLCSTLMLASGLCWLREERTGKQELWGIVFLGLALLAKAAAIVMPPIVVAYDVLIARKKLSEAIPRQIIPAFLCVVLLNVTMSAQNLYMGGMRGHMDLSKWHILGIDSIIMWRYIGMLVVPFNLSLLYDPATTGIAAAVTWSLLGWGAVAAVCWFWRKTRPGVVFAVFCWFCLLAPVLNLFPITTLMNDRYLYLPCVCFFAIASTVGLEVMAWGGCFDAPEEGGKWSWSMLGSHAMASVAIASIVFSYAFASMQRLPMWRNDFALWSETVRRVPQLPVVQIQWADALHAQGKDQAAIAALRLTVAKYKPDAADTKRIWKRLSDWEPESAETETSFVSIETDDDVPPLEEDCDCEKAD